MLALIALICFVVGLAGKSPLGLDMLFLGLAFVAAHLLFPWRPWSKNPG